MKTIIIKDTVYRKLSEVKNSKSFSELLDELVEESKTSKLSRLKKYIGIITEKEADSMEKASKKFRREFKARM